MNANVKPPSHSCPAYVCARVRKALAAHGLPLRKMKGHYTAFCNQQIGTEGFYARRIGCSRTVDVGYAPAYRDGCYGTLPRGTFTAKLKEAVELLRSLGYRITESGNIECDYDS